MDTTRIDRFRSELSRFGLGKGQDIELTTLDGWQTVGVVKDVAVGLNRSSDLNILFITVTNKAIGDIRVRWDAVRSWK